MVIVLPLSMRGPIESVARLVSRFANISFYRCVGLSTSPPSDSLLIQCLLSSRLLGVRARSSPNLRPDPWGGIGHPTGNPAGLDGAGTGARRSDYCLGQRDTGLERPGCPHSRKHYGQKPAGAFPTVLSRGTFFRSGPMRWHLRSSESYAKNCICSSTCNDLQLSPACGGVGFRLGALAAFGRRSTWCGAATVRKILCLPPRANRLGDTFRASLGLA